MINRRLMIVPPAMPSSGRTEQLDEREKKFLRLLLEMANMRVVCCWNPSPGTGHTEDFAKQMVANADR
jgi:hypothetical protein